MKKRSTIIFLVLAAILLTPCLFASPARAADYVIDTKKSHAFINFRISHLGYSWILGRFNKFEGVFSFDENDPTASTLKVTIDPASIDTNHAERDKHLRGKKFLDVAQFPNSKFISTSITRADGGGFMVKGKFTLHGVTRDIIIKAEEIGAGTDPWGGFRRGFKGTTSLKLKDFGVTYDLGPASAIVHLEFSIEGIKK